MLKNSSNSRHFPVQSTKAAKENTQNTQNILFTVLVFLIGVHIFGSTGIGAPSTDIL